MTKTNVFTLFTFGGGGGAAAEGCDFPVFFLLPSELLNALCFLSLIAAGIII